MIQTFAIFLTIYLGWQSCGESASKSATGPQQDPASAIVGYWLSSCLNMDESQSLIKYYAISQKRILITHMSYATNAACQGEPDVRDRFYGEYTISTEATNSVAPLIYPIDINYQDVRRTYLASVDKAGSAFGYSTWQVGEEKSIAGRSLDNASGTTTMVAVGEKSYQIISVLQNDRFILGKIDEKQRPKTEATRVQGLDLTHEYIRDLNQGQAAQLPELAPPVEDPNNTGE